MEVKPVNLGSFEPEFVACSPFRKMPGFRDGDFAISDSSAIIAYLETKFPAPPLIPVEASRRARTIWYEEFADTILIPSIGKAFFNLVVAPRFLKREGDLAVAEKAEKEELPPLLAYRAHDAGERLSGGRPANARRPSGGEPVREHAASGD